MTVRVSGPRGLPPLDRARLRRRALRVLRALDLADSELSIRLVDDAEIAHWNARYRGRPRATDVLSFSLVEGAHAERRGALLGDVVISVATAERHARALGRTLAQELDVLALHGFLHVLGYDHETDDGTMDRLEGKLRKRLLGRA
jgi:probable rRNA maturation factor